MSINRVQKLLFSEYCDFEDMVLIESPFAQTTREGKGIRQVYLGLTPTKFVLATDVIPPVEKSCYHFMPGIDPDIETFELIAIYPVECVNLSIFCRQKRQALKAHFCNNKILYFELGGFEKREMFWNLWRERIRFLSPNDGAASSRSQTSVASSSTTSSSALYLVDSKEVVKANGVKQLWCHFGTGNERTPNQWTNRDVYLGKEFEERAETYRPKTKRPKLKDFVKNAGLTRNKISPTASQQSTHISLRGSGSLVNRFGNGIKENCSSTLFLINKDLSFNKQVNNFILHDNVIKLWEQNRKKGKPKRYRFCPYPYFLQGLGPWALCPGSNFSAQIKRAVSTVNLKKPPVESGLRLPLSRRQLVTTISCDVLNPERIMNRPTLHLKPTILFWTPCYWYRPRAAKDGYEELRNHLKSIKKWREWTDNKNFLLKKFKHSKSHQIKNEINSDVEIDLLEPSGRFINEKNLYRKELTDGCWCLFSRFVDQCVRQSSNNNPLQQLKQSLRIDVILTAWDFDSWTLAVQLTIIDRDLFSRITAVELGVVMTQQSSKNAANVMAMIAFAHRVTCLISSEILHDESEKVRARLVARFINVAEKCHRISNYHSCKSVLCGLQSPAIFRLKLTWIYVRKKHSSVYQSYKKLCKIYRDERLPIYQKSFFSTRKGPYLPYIGHVLSELFDRIPDFKKYETENIPPKKNLLATSPITELAAVQKPEISSLGKYLKPVNFWSSKKPDNQCKEVQNRNLPSPKRLALSDYYPPLTNYQDNRLKCLEQTKKFLRLCQLAASKYHLKKNELACDYLFKTRYCEHRENFCHSLVIEPPKSCNAKNK